MVRETNAMRSGLNGYELLLTETFGADLAATLERMSAEDYAGRIWGVDPNLWRPEPEHHAEIRERLGWLTLPADCLAQVEELTAFADEVRAAGFEHVVLLGMGGSSLAPWAFEAIFGVADGYPGLTVLDSTVPAQVRATLTGGDAARTLFIVASKSGGTAEVLSFYEHFLAEVRELKGGGAGENFVVITDPGSALQKLGEERGVRRIFENWPDHGGRYSAMSYFGMVPAALIGAPTGEILGGGQSMAEACGPDVPADENPGMVLGALLGYCHEVGRNKLTLLASPGLAAFGEWVEQLLAESTGKEGVGIVPVVGEPVGEVADYGVDRVFAYMRLAGDDTHDALAEALAAGGHPVIRIDVSDPATIGAEMFRWEFATAVAGAFMGIDPFDQPNVEEAKNKARAALEDFTQDGSLPALEPDATDGELSVYGAPDAGSVTEAIGNLMASVQPGDYVALMAYLPYADSTDDALSSMRAEVRAARGVATTVGYGPRFLHSTGQLHKGGPEAAVFLQLTAGDPDDLPIPGKPYSFAVLKNAQAAGDLGVLRDHGLRALRVDLGSDVAGGLKRVAELLRAALT